MYNQINILKFNNFIYICKTVSIQVGQKIILGKITLYSGLLYIQAYKVFFQST